MHAAVGTASIGYTNTFFAMRMAPVQGSERKKDDWEDLCPPPLPSPERGKEKGTRGDRSHVAHGIGSIIVVV